MASLMMVNPRKRRAKKRVARRKSPARRLATVKTVSTRKYRRNPSPRVGSAVSTIKSGAIGAAGAVATEVILSKLPLPAALSSGNGKIAASALVSVGLGMMVAKYGKNKSLGMDMAQGGVTVALHSTLRGMVAGPMGLAGSEELMGYDAGLMGGFYDDFNDGMGYTSNSATYEMGAIFDEDENEFDY